MLNNTITKVVLLLEGAVKTITRLNPDRWGIKVVRPGAKDVEYDNILTELGAYTVTKAFDFNGVMDDGKTLVYNKRRHHVRSIQPHG